MGIPMIHAEAPKDAAADDALDFEHLLDRRTEIETEMNRYAAILDLNHIDLHSSLLTSDGYPRSDIDVANVRIARTAIIRLKNDYRALEMRIESAVHEAFKNGTPLAAKRKAGASSAQQAASAGLAAAFAHITSVAEGSPAAEAGLHADDRVITFGPVTITNHDQLQGLAREVQRAVSEHASIRVTVGRTTGEGVVLVTKELWPKNAWGGRGAVGAHFMPC